MTTRCIAVLAAAVLVAQEARSAAFVQNGKVPASYVIGAVDGKTSWSNYSIMGERLGGPNANKGSAPYITPTWARPSPMPP